MITLGFDLAPRHSGVVILNDDKVIYSKAIDVGPESDGFESHAQTMMSNLDDMEMWLQDNKIKIDIAVVEDVAVQMVKPANALRLQGLVRWYLSTVLQCDTITIMASVWQKWYGWKKIARMTSKGWASYVVKALDYSFTGTKGKALTDLNDAALIARWGYEVHKDKYE